MIIRNDYGSGCYLFRMQRVVPKKSLGQNFLVDKNVAEKIARLFDPELGEKIVEIGPGEGALTTQLLEKGGSVIAVEIDPRAATAIRERFGEQVQVLEGDILQTDLTSIARQNGLATIRVIGNIPYYITSPILFHLIDNRSGVSEAVLMMQREVAERLTAQPRTKEYGILAVMTQTYCRPERLFNVPPSCFFPRPKVTSTVVRLRFKGADDVNEVEREHRQLVRSAFGKRRKTLNNSLTELIPNAEERAHIFAAAQINPNARAEELTPEDFLRFARVFATAGTGSAGREAERDDL